MKKYVSVLEDDDSLRELFTVLLEEEDYLVSAYPTATSFIRSLEGQLPDLIILDVRLPDGNGIEICAQIKADLRTAHIPIILASAHTDFNNPHQTNKADSFINKPFDIQTLIDTVKLYA